MKQHFDYPLAVYVGTFADGTIARLSVGARKGKIDFDRARRMVCRMWREGALPDHSERQGGSDIFPLLVAVNADGTPYRVEQYWSTTDRTDIVAGHVEHDGQIRPDPFFAPERLEVIAGGKRKPVAPAARVLGAIDKLSWAEIEALQSAIDARLAA